MNELIERARFAARFEFNSGWRIGEKDEAAFKIAYLILLDRDLANKIVDDLVDEWIEKHTVEKLPDLNGEIVWVDGEMLRKRAPYYSHGDDVFSKETGKWYMYCQGKRWSQQTPFDPNSQYNRSRVVERTLEFQKRCDLAHIS